MRPIYLWLLFIVSILNCAISFPLMLFDAEQRAMWGKTFGLNVKDADGKPHDGVEEAIARIEAAPWSPHIWKNLLREWVECYPKLAAKFFSFVIVVQAVALVWIVIV